MTIHIQGNQNAFFNLSRRMKFGVSSSPKTGHFRIPMGDSYLKSVIFSQTGVVNDLGYRQ